MGDVYEQKMDNLREFLKENGRADWISNNAWLVKYHLIFYLLDFFSVIIIAISAMFVIWIGVELD
jgi:ABC-type protease/lipase transport system fused ATPase/permease subunit